MIRRIFISSVQRKLAEERKAIVDAVLKNPLFYVKCIEELGSGTVDMFDICKDTGLQPPVFDIDARHFNVTVYRPAFDEKGNRVSSGIGPNGTEVKVKPEEVGPKNLDVGPKPDFEVVMRAYRKDFRMTCASVWACLAADSTLSRASGSRFIEARRIRERADMDCKEMIWTSQ